ncbi:MAG: potassium transporter TrkA [Actinobacteria bacterium]|nr:potassium transporter TrkA [Actinomycetota bacterium]
MKTLASKLAYFIRGRARKNLKALLGYIVFLIVMIIVYALLFRHFMWRFEGREYSLIGGIYWTITAMTTLGFGDITFHTDGGHIYSMIVTLSGVFFMLIVLPFGAIRLFVAPWMEERLRYKPPLELPVGTQGHVVLCGWDSVTRTLADNLQAAGIEYVTIESDYQRVVQLDEEGVSVIYGIPTDAQVLTRARVDKAQALVANMSDTDNANLMLTTRSLCNTPVVTMVTEAERVDLMQAAGATQTVALREILGGYLAVRATTRGAMSHVVDSLGDLLFAEIPAHGTPLCGQTLTEARLRSQTGVSVIGIWKRGRFTLPRPDTRITDEMVLVLVGEKRHLEILERLIGESSTDDLVIVLGYGTVGRAAAGFLADNNVDYVLVDKDFEQIQPVNVCARPPSPSSGSEATGDATGRRVAAEMAGGLLPASHVVLGDASRRATLIEAGIREAHGLIVTTNDDGVNVFLTLACRQLNPHIRIVARANREENVSEIYAAGADFVVSHSSVGANILTNIIEGRKTVFLTEGVHIFWRPVPPELNGVTLAQTHVRAATGATVIAVQTGDSDPDLRVGPDTVLNTGSTLLMVGSPESETAFSKRYRV